MVKENLMTFNRAKKYLVGGVNSPVRSFSYVGGQPLLIKKGKGARIYDYDSKRYIDYVLSWGSLILGHAHPAVMGALKKRIDQGLSFGATNALEIELAAAILEAIPAMDKIRFVNSGTEAVMAALRLARGYTKRDRIIKFEHSYHGHADYLLAASGSGLATLSIARSRGVPEEFIKNTLVAPYGDSEYLIRTFRKYGSKVAAVIFEPVGGNYGVIPPDISFLRFLRSVTSKYGALLVADEVITGFRSRFGSLSEEFGITPDLITLGKIIGGGLPVGACAGKEKVMRYLAPLGKVYQASTFAGNPIVMQAGVSTLLTLKKLQKKYPNLRDLTVELTGFIREQAGEYAVPLEVNSYGSMFSLKFKSREGFKKFYKGMLDAGVFLAPSEYESNFLSFAHTGKDIEETKKAVKSALSRVRER
ncbi:MAG: glutamate-1-semialdehyde 2,1-aminomutase [Candidatus Omnitrophica bacterium]|nr:glutamate-1-semialdehyde 2,1-aminomutase [Candidatus Omnitrophota bacterium]MDD5552289.1 glutamate-1-semialdehyde 2,1-aminomutase [Candidatus Omnitrophota bacterium]